MTIGAFFYAKKKRPERVGRFVFICELPHDFF
jgi:hypothetical protein